MEENNLEKKTNIIHLLLVGTILLVLFPLVIVIFALFLLRFIDSTVTLVDFLDNLYWIYFLSILCSFSFGIYAYLRSVFPKTFCVSVTVSILPLIVFSLLTDELGLSGIFSLSMFLSSIVGYVCLKFFHKNKMISIALFVVFIFLIYSIYLSIYQYLNWGPRHLF